MQAGLYVGQNWMQISGSSGSILAANQQLLVSAALFGGQLITASITKKVKKQMTHTVLIVRFGMHTWDGT
jgi:hypothetical protein